MAGVVQEVSAQTNKPKRSPLKSPLIFDGTEEPPNEPNSWPGHSYGKDQPQPSRPKRRRKTIVRAARKWWLEP